MGGWKNEMHGDVQVSDMRHAFRASLMMTWFLRFPSEFFTFLSVEMQMFFFNLVDRKVRLFTDKQDFLTLLHLRSFRQFQNLSEETRSHAVENLVELCFVAFLSNKSKKCFIPVWIIFPSSEIIAISSLHFVVWTFWQQTLRSQWTEIWCYILWN